MLGTADVSQNLIARPKPTVPVFPGAKSPVESQQEGGAAVSYVASASQAELDSFYGEVLGASGWARDEELNGWVKDGSLLTVTRTARPDGTASVAVLIRSGGGAK